MAQIKLQTGLRDVGRRLPSPSATDTDVNGGETVDVDVDETNGSHTPDSCPRRSSLLPIEKKVSFGWVLSVALVPRLEP